MAKGTNCTKFTKRNWEKKSTTAPETRPVRSLVATVTFVLAKHTTMGDVRVGEQETLREATAGMSNGANMARALAVRVFLVWDLVFSRA